MLNLQRQRTRVIFPVVQELVNLKQSNVSKETKLLSVDILLMLMKRKEIYSMLDTRRGRTGCEDDPPSGGGTTTGAGKLRKRTANQPDRSW